MKINAYHIACKLNKTFHLLMHASRIAGILTSLRLGVSVIFWWNMQRTYSYRKDLVKCNYKRRKINQLSSISHEWDLVFYFCLLINTLDLFNKYSWMFILFWLKGFSQPNMNLLQPLWINIHNIV